MVAGGTCHPLYWWLVAPLFCPERLHASHRTVKPSQHNSHLDSPSSLPPRFLTGFAGGAFVLAAPAYSAEIAETKYRGALGTVMQLMVTLGILFINVNCSTNWKGLLAVKFYSCQYPSVASCQS